MAVEGLTKIFQEAQIWVANRLGNKVQQSLNSRTESATVCDTKYQGSVVRHVQTFHLQKQHGIHVLWYNGTLGRRRRGGLGRASSRAITDAMFFFLLLFTSYCCVPDFNDYPF